RLARLVVEPVGFVRLLCLREDLVEEQFEMMMRRFDFLELVAQEAQRVLLCAIEGFLSRAEVLLRFTDSGAVFPKIDPRNRERNSRTQFTHSLRSVIVTLRFYRERRIGNPGPLRQLKVRFLDTDPRFGHFDLWPVGEKKWA